MISGLDFNPTGEYVATIDEEGMCLISDVNKNDYSFHMQFPSGSYGGKVRMLKYFLSATLK